MSLSPSQSEIIRKWCHEAVLPPLTEGNLRWNIARARAAEAKLAEYRQFLRTMKNLMGEL